MKEQGEPECELEVGEAEDATDEYHLEGLGEAWRNRRSASPGSEGFKRRSNHARCSEMTSAVADKGDQRPRTADGQKKAGAAGDATQPCP